MKFDGCIGYWVGIELDYLVYIWRGCRKMVKQEIVVYGVGAHLGDMLTWYPEMAECIVRVVDKDKRKQGKRYGGLSCVVEKPAVLRTMPEGSIIAVSALRYFDEIVKEVKVLNPGLHCQTLDEIWKSIRSGCQVLEVEDSLSALEKAMARARMKIVSAVTSDETLQTLCSPEVVGLGTLTKRLSKHWRLNQEMEQFCVDMHDYAAFFHANERVYLYGAGYLAKEFMQAAALAGLRPSGLLVSKGHRRQAFLAGLAVLEISEANLDEEKDGILLAVSDENSRNRILEEIRLCFGERIKVCCLRTKAIANKSWKPSPFFGGYTELDALGTQMKTDKCHEGHNFLSKYEFFLHSWRDKKFCLMELGVFNGSSLMMWSRYFAQAKCIGVDIEARCRAYAGGNREVVIADLGEEENLLQLAKMEPDVVIDDASHLWSHQIKALIYLWPVLPHGGIYICEDIHTAYYSEYDDAIMSGYDFLAAIARIVANKYFPRKDKCWSGSMSLDREAEAVAASVELISFLGGSCVMVKR